MKIITLPLLLIMGCSTAHSMGRHRFVNTPVAIIQSVPTETNLAIPGLTFAKDAWVKMIDESTQTIDIEQMYIQGQAGESLEPVISALQRAAARGVKTRFLLSKKMIDNDKQTLATLKAIPNLEVRTIDLGAITGGIQHAKFFIFDQRAIFIGSQNFDWKALTQILETGVAIIDDKLSIQLQSIFDLDWEIAGTGKVPSDLGTTLSSNPNADVKLVASPPSLNPKNIKSALVELTELLNNAKKTIRITVMDYSTYMYGAPGEWKDLDAMIRKTAARGIKIQLLVSHWNTAKPAINTIKSLSLVPNVELKIATIPEASTGSISFARVNHSKMMIIDDSILWVGTSNWSHGYFLATRGIEIVMNRPDLADIGNKIFNKLWSAPYTANVDVNFEYPKPRK